MAVQMVEKKYCLSVQVVYLMPTVIGVMCLSQMQTCHSEAIRWLFFQGREPHPADSD